MLCFLCLHAESSSLVDKRSAKKSTDVVRQFSKIVHEFENGGRKSNNRRECFNDSLSPPICQQCFSKLKSVTVSHSAVYKVEASVRRCQKALLLEMKNLQCSLDKLYMEMEAVGTIINCSQQGGINDEDVIAAEYRSQMLKAISSLVIFRNKLREKTVVKLEDFVDKNNDRIKAEPHSDHNTVSDDELPMDEFESTADFQSLNGWKRDATNENNDEDNLVDPLASVKTEKMSLGKATTARYTKAKRKVTNPNKNYDHHKENSDQSEMDFDNDQEPNSDHDVKVDPLHLPKAKKSAPQGSKKRKIESDDVNYDDDDDTVRKETVYTNSDDDDNETSSNPSAEWNEGTNSHPTVRITRSKNQFSPRAATSSSLANKLTAFPCALETCGEIFTNKISLRRHMVKNHQGSKKFVCSCGLYFLTYELRAVHREESDIHPEYQKRKKPSPPEVKAPRPPKVLQTCDLCGMELMTASEILEHVRGHVGDYAIKCPNANCPQMYSTHIMLLYHIRISRKCRKAVRNQEFSCETCAFKAKVHRKLRIHVDRFHERDLNKSFKCPIASCDKSFCVRQGVQFHLGIHLYSDAIFQMCEHCQNRIKTDEMGEHLKSEHEAKEFITCQQCPYSFSSRASLLEHIYAHRHKDINCDICNDNVKYSRHHELQEHYQQIHNVFGKQYGCEQCGQILWTKPGLAHHIRVKHSMDEQTPKKRWPCDACFGKVDFNSEPSLVAHKIKVHGETPFVCTLCRVTFRSKAALSRHQKEHEGTLIKKLFKCDVAGCGKDFSTKDKLKSHVSIIHLGQRNHVCDLCGSTFGNSTHLKQHHALVHLGERTHICDVCGQSFGNSGTLKNHARIHTGERPFACELCGQAFNQSSVLRRHLEAHEKKGADFKPKGPMKTRKRKAQ